MNSRGFAETLLITLVALLASLALFGAFMLIYAHVPPRDLFYWMYMGGFGTRFSWQDSLTRAAPGPTAGAGSEIPSAKSGRASKIPASQFFG